MLKCPDQGSFENGLAIPRLDSPNIPFPGTMNFKCNTGYTIEGSASRTCNFRSGQWSGRQPTCSREFSQVVYSLCPSHIFWFFFFQEFGVGAPQPLATVEPMHLENTSMGIRLNTSATKDMSWRIGTDQVFNVEKTDSGQTLMSSVSVSSQLLQLQCSDTW